MKEVSREEYLNFYFHKEGIKGYPKKENGIMHYNVFQNGNDPSNRHNSDGAGR